MDIAIRCKMGKAFFRILVDSAGGKNGGVQVVVIIRNRGNLEKQGVRRWDLARHTANS